MGTPESELIVGVVLALDSGPTMLDAIIASIPRDIVKSDSPESLRGAILQILERLRELEIVNTIPVPMPGGGFGYELAVDLDVLAPLLKTLGRDPWSRLSDWKTKLMAKPSTVRGILPTSLGSSPKPNYYVQEVFFVSDRLVTETGGGLSFTSDRSVNGRITYGRSEVSIPNEHQLGSLETLSFVRLEFRSNPEKHITVLSTQKIDKEAFYLEMKKHLVSDNSAVLVFVHGYNVRFEDALRRTAQIAFDLQFDGIPITYSWPSQGDLAQYTVDETNAEWSQPHFQEFLTTLAEQTAADRINIIAHSMGNRIVARSIASLSSREGHERYAVCVLAAPDIDRDVFLQMSQALAAGARNVILYASSRDRALRASKLVHGYPRAGESDKDIAVCDGIQTVDVSALEADFTGHSYFGNNLNVVSDLYYLLRGQVPRRFRLREEKGMHGSCWRFMP